MTYGRFYKYLNLSLLSFLSLALVACSNAVPNVESLLSSKKPTVVAPKDSKSFFQLSGSSKKSVTGDNYKGTLRVSQPSGQLQAQSVEGYKLKGTVTLQK